MPKKTTKKVPEGEFDILGAAKEIEIKGLRNWLKCELTRAFTEARKNKTTTFNEHQYEISWPDNILRLTEAILDRTYRPSASISFVIFDPMVREIFAAPFNDRVIHHFLNHLQGGWWDRRLINSSYSCRVGKGTYYGIQHVQKMMMQVSNNFSEDAYYAKLDIQGYFMSLPRQRLYERVKWGLKRQFGPYMHIPEVRQIYQICDFLWRRILMDDPVKRSRKRGPVGNWNALPPEKSLYTRDPGLGIVIGNYTSQLVSNVYLDQFDRYVMHELGYKYYGRYVDDFIILVKKSELPQLKEDIKKMERFLKVQLKLTLHPRKRSIQPITNGIPFLGARIYPHCLYPSDRFQAKFKRLLAKVKSGEARTESIISYFGYLMNLDSYNYVKRLFKKYDLDFRLYQEFISPKRRRPVPEIIAELRKSHWQGEA